MFLTKSFTSALLSFALIAPATAAEKIPGGSPAPPRVAAASDEGESAIKRFRLPKGFKCELVAAEPLLANPVAFTIDEQGRFYVAETFRLHAGVTDIRGHMDWLDEELASKSVEERVAIMTRHEGRKISDYTKYSDRLKLVWDSNGDGRADKASVFADGFNQIADGIASGVLARKGDVYFANIPNLWLLRDTNNDGKAEFKKSLSYGYGVRVGFLGHDLHGLRIGPDGKLYFTVGDRGAHIKLPGGEELASDETGCVFRCNLDGSDLEIFATGLRNPQELVFDEYGNLWTGDNNSDGGDPARWVYVVEGGDSGWRVGWQFLERPARGAWLTERLCYPQWDGQAAYILPPIANITSGPSGLTYDPGTGLPDQFKRHFFLCDFRGGTGSGIHSFAVRPRGAGFELHDRTDFVWEMLVTDCDFGYDGAMYITDWVNGWNQTGKGRIYRVYDPESRSKPEVAEVNRLIAEGFEKRPVKELAKLLEHLDQRVRQEAQFALAAKSGGIDAFEAVLKTAGEGGWTAYSPEAKAVEPRLACLHAIWGLGQAGSPKLQTASPSKPIEILMLLLNARDSEFRAQAAKVLGDLRVARASEHLIQLLSDPEPRPRFFAASALGKLGKKEAVPALLQMLRANDNQDRYLRHAGVMGLVGCADVPTLAALARDDSPGVRMAAVLALRRKESTEIGAFLQDSDPIIVAEAARAISDLPIAPSLPPLAALLNDTANLSKLPAGDDKKPGPRDPILRRVINANFRLGTGTNAASLAAFAASSSAPESLCVEALNALGDWAKPSGRDRITGLWRPLTPRDGQIAVRALQPRLTELLSSPASAVKLAAIEVAAKLNLPAASDLVFAFVGNTNQPARLRVAALKALDTLKSPRLGDAVKLASSDRDESLRTEATKLQAKLKPRDATAGWRQKLEKGSIGEKQAALRALGALPGAAADGILSTWMDKLSAKQVPAELQLDVLIAAEQRPALKEKTTQYHRARDPKDDLRAWRECLAGGDAAEGKKIFAEKPETQCIRCHKAGGEGGEVGPDLSHLGAQKDRAYLMEAILFPNKHIAQGYESLIVEMKNGTTYAGIAKSETDIVLELNSPEDGLLKLNKANIKARERSLSPMPEELRQVLTKDDIRNLVEFLSGLK